MNGFPSLAPNDPQPDDGIRIRRLTAADAPLITNCFRRVYGDSYANELFYRPQQLAARIEQQQLLAVGADKNGELVGHMAMTIPHIKSRSAELGNTVVDPSARGGGIAWRVGDALISWCRERGYSGFLHYPTTDHHIMQRQSVKAGFETGLMLGYIPAETDGQVHADQVTLRQAATVVYQPLAPSPPQTLYCPKAYTELLRELAAPTGLTRDWQTAPNGTADPLAYPQSPVLQQFSKRKLERFTLTHFSSTAALAVDAFLTNATCEDGKPRAPCQQLDLAMNDPNIGYVHQLAERAGFHFCAWLPGFTDTDILRLQRCDAEVTDLGPQVVNLTAQKILARIQAGDPA